jgi:fucose permease
MLRYVGTALVALVVLAVALYPRSRGAGTPALAVPGGRTPVVSANSTWRTVYRWDLVFIFSFMAFFALVPFPRREAGASEKIDFKHIGKTAVSPTMLLYYCAYALYVAVEIGIASWMVEYLQKVYGQSVSQSTLALSIFFGLIMVGRFVGSFIVERLGYLHSILFAALAASVCIGLSLYGPTQFVWLLPASGFFFSIIFPTLTASVSSTYQANLNSLLGLLFTFAGFGGLFGPWLIGVASDLGGIKFGFSLNLVYCLLTAAAAFILLRLQSQKAMLAEVDQTN